MERVAAVVVLVAAAEGLPLLEMRVVPALAVLAVTQIFRVPPQGIPWVGEVAGLATRTL